MKTENGNNGVAVLCFGVLFVALTCALASNSSAREFNPNTNKGPAFHAIGNCAGKDDTQLIATALEGARGEPLLIPANQICAVGEVEIPNLRIERGGLLKSIRGQTVTLSGDFDAGNYQIFDQASGGRISFAGAATSSYRPEWFPGIDSAAQINALISALPASGGYIDARGLTNSVVATTININKNGVHLAFGPGTLTSTANPIISVTGNFATIEGSGVFATQLFVNSATNDGIVVSGPISGLHIANLSLPCHSNSSTRTGGKGISLNTVGDYTIENLYISDGWDSLYLSRSSSGSITNVTINATLPGPSLRNGVTVTNNSISTFLTHVIVTSSRSFNAGFLVGKETDTFVCEACGVQGGDDAGPAFGFEITSEGSSSPPRWIRISNSFVEPERSGGIGVQILQAEDIELDGLYSLWGRNALHSTGAVQNLRIRGGLFGLARQHGIFIEGGQDVLVEGATVTENSQASNNAYDGIVSQATGARIQGVRAGTGLIATLMAVSNRGKQRFGIFAGGDNAIIIGNDLRSNASGGLKYVGGASRTIRNNLGFVTRNSGTTVIADGTTSIVVRHGLDMTPNAHDITVTPANDLGRATKFWVTAVTAESFTIRVDASPGPGTAIFSWGAEIE